MHRENAVIKQDHAAVRRLIRYAEIAACIKSEAAEDCLRVFRQRRDVISENGKIHYIFHRHAMPFVVKYR